MNVERLITLAEALEGPIAAGKFGMSDFFTPANSWCLNLSAGEAMHTCGSAGCIAGWAAALFEPAAMLLDVNCETVGRLLGLNYCLASALFVPPVFDSPARNPYKASAAEAAKVVRHLALTGVVDWGVAFD